MMIANMASAHEKLRPAASNGVLAWAFNGISTAHVEWVAREDMQERESLRDDDFSRLLKSLVAHCVIFSSDTHIQTHTRTHSLSSFQQHIIGVQVCPRSVTGIDCSTELLVVVCFNVLANKPSLFHLCVSPTILSRHVYPGRREESADILLSGIGLEAVLRCAFTALV